MAGMLPGAVGGARPFGLGHDSPVKQRPVTWKPRYATRRMRENAWTKAELRRERAVRAAAPRRSWLARLFRRGS
jgi:hypothetical protein